MAYETQIKHPAIDTQRRHFDWLRHFNRAAQIPESIVSEHFCRSSPTARRTLLASLPSTRYEWREWAIMLDGNARVTVANAIRESCHE
jgi:hypothetical protein